MKEVPFREALLEASRLRFRPIVMTTLTILVISIPMLLNQGSGSEFGKSMSVVIVGGITVSAIMTFYVVPAAFYLFERRRAEKEYAEARRVGAAERVALPSAPPSGTQATSGA